MIPNVETATQYADEGRIEDWIMDYLNMPEWQNTGLSEAIQDRKGLWVGPVEVETNGLRRSAGPEDQGLHPHIVWHYDPEVWESEVSSIEGSITDNLLLPPLIIRCEQGIFGIQDGNRRYEAIKRKGMMTCWVLIEYDNTEDKNRYPI